MLNLIAKDILIQKKQALFSLVYVLLIIFSFQSMGEGMFSASVVAFTYMMVMTSCAYEEKNKADIMMNSLPIKRSAIVLAKYLSVVVFFIMGTLAYIIITSILTISVFPIKVYPLSLEGAIGGFMAVSLLSGFFLPVFFKVGYIKSKIFNFILFFVFFLGISSIAGLLKNNEKIGLLKNIADFFQSKGDLFIAAFVLGAVVIFVFISYSLATWFYKKREF